MQAVFGEHGAAQRRLRKTERGRSGERDAEGFILGKPFGENRR